MGMFDEDIYGSATTQQPSPIVVPEDTASRPGMFREDIYQTPQAPLPSGALDWSRYNQPFGELKSYTPGFSEYVKQKGQQAILATGQALGGKPDPYMAGRVAGGIVDVAGFTPMGTILSGGEAVSDIGAGHYGRAAIDLVGALPGVGQARRIVQKVRGELPIIRMADTPTRTVDPVTGRIDDELLNSSGRAYDRIAQAPIEYHPNTIADYVQRAKYYLQQPGARGVFTPESAPGVFSLLDRRVNELRDRGVTKITPGDFETLRQQLKGFTEGADSAAGQRAAAILDNYMHGPPPGAITAMAPGAMDTLRADMAIARGDWRAGKTAATVEKEIDRAGTRAGGAASGRNVDNLTRQRLENLTTTDAGEAKIFGATYPEKQAINAVVIGDPVTNKFRYLGNRMGGGGGIGGTAMGGVTGHTVNSLLGSWGIDPVTAVGIGSMVGYAYPKVGEAFRQIANQRTVRAAEDVVDQIRRNSPLYRAREAMAPPIVDPFAMQRDAIAYAMIPPAVKSAQQLWDTAHVPYENR